MPYILKWIILFQQSFYSIYEADKTTALLTKIQKENDLKKSCFIVISSLFELQSFK